VDTEVLKSLAEVWGVGLHPGLGECLLQARDRPVEEGVGESVRNISKLPEAMQKN
jgi:hypothetical protein